MIRTTHLNIPFKYDPKEPLVAVVYDYSPGRPSPNFIHPSDDDGEAPECDIKTIDGHSYKCFDDDLLAELTEQIMEHHGDGPTEADMLADEGDRKYHAAKEEGRTS